MSTGTAVEKAAPPQVPDLIRTPALEIEAEDVALPRLYIGQYMSEHVQEGTVKAGSFFTALGKDDPDPQVIWEPDSKDRPVIHVIAMRRGKSISVDGDLQLYAYDDPDAPADAWVTYNYVIAIPAVDQDMPFKWLLTRTGSPTAKQINTVLKKTEAKGPAFEQAFEIWTDPRENAKGKFFVPKAKFIEADAKNIEIASSLAVMVSPDAASVTASNDEPDI